MIPLEMLSAPPAERWVAAVNADRTYGQWRYAVAKKTTEVPQIISSLAEVTGMVGSTS